MLTAKRLSLARGGPQVADRRRAGQVRESRLGRVTNTSRSFVILIKILRTV